MITLSGPENFKEWRATWRRELIRLGLWENVVWEGPSKGPRDHIAAVMISSSVSDPICDYIEGYESPAKMWEALKCFEHCDVSEITQTPTINPQVSDTEDGRTSEMVLCETAVENIECHVNIKANEGIHDSEDCVVKKEVDQLGLSKGLINGDADPLGLGLVTGTDIIPIYRADPKMRKRCHNGKEARKESLREAQHRKVAKTRQIYGRRTERRRRKAVRKKGLRGTQHRKAERKRQVFGRRTERRRRRPEFRSNFKKPMSLIICRSLKNMISGANDMTSTSGGLLGLDSSRQSPL
jgi:hypothetical protein